MAWSARKRRQTESEPFEFQRRRVEKRQNTQGLDPGLKAHCAEILQLLMQHGHGKQFSKRVDPVASNFPDYLYVIRKPIDLGTIKSDLEKGYYSSADSFAADVRRVFLNAMIYYPRGNYVRAAAQHLSNLFNTKWEETMAKFSVHRPLPPPKTKGLSSLPSSSFFSPEHIHGGRTETCSPSSSTSTVIQSQGLFGVHSIANTGGKDDDSVIATLVVEHSGHSVATVTEKSRGPREGRVELLKLRFSDTLSKANKILKGVPDSPPEQRTKRRDSLRKSARRRISSVQKSVMFDHDSKHYLRELEKLCGCGSKDPFLNVGQGFPLKELGLHIKDEEYDLQGLDEDVFLSGDWEEGEIIGG
ncbi:hypothetical protein ACFX13_047265 [Malus domestica]|uniref:uncharacterized protein n=1 Tax=Malus domestica TaxID=3750 RepID=UPI00049892F4